MNTRLTWRDVTAPDFGDALQGFALSGDLIGNAADTFSGAMNSIVNNRKQRASAKALDAAMRVRDAGSWDQALAAEGMAAFGLDPTLATPEFVDFLTKQRDVLAGAAMDDQDLATSKWNLSRAQELAPFEDARNADTLIMNDQTIRNNDRLYEMGVYRDGQEKLTDAFGNEEALYEQGRARKQDERDDKDLLEADILKQKGKDALLLAQEITRNNPPGDAQRALNRMNIADPIFERLVSEAINNQPEGRNSIDPRFEGTSSLLPEFQVASNALGARERQLNLQLSNNPTLQLYVEGTEQAARYGSPALAMVENLRGTLDPGKTGDEKESIMRSSVATINDKLTKFEREFPGVPASIISRVMENNLDRAHWFSGQLNFNDGAIRDQLRGIATPEQINLLETERANVEQRINENREFRDQVEILRAGYEWALSNNKPQAAQQYLTQLNTLMGMLAPQQPAAPSMTTPGNPAPVPIVPVAPAIGQFGTVPPTSVKRGDRRN